MKTLGKAALGAVCAFALVIGGGAIHRAATMTDQEWAALDAKIEADRAAEQVKLDALARQNAAAKAKREEEKAVRKERERIEALRESLDYDRRIYTRLCSGWGKNFAIHEMGGVQKYKDDSLSFLAGARTAREKNELLTDAECDAAFEKGTREGVAAVRNGDVKMRLW